MEPNASEHSLAWPNDVTGDNGGCPSVVDRTTKKNPTPSWKDKLLGGSLALLETNSDAFTFGIDGDSNNDLERLPDDVQTSIVNGVPAFRFSDPIKGILFKEMELTVVIKLLGRNNGYNTLYNRISNLWKPISQFHLMNIENGYYLVQFMNKTDYDCILSQGPWIIFGQYLTVQPWSKDFNPQQPYPDVVLAWIRLLGLLGFMFRRQIMEAIGGSSERCGKYGHVKNLCWMADLDPIPGEGDRIISRVAKNVIIRDEGQSMKALDSRPKSDLATRPNLGNGQPNGLHVSINNKAEVECNLGGLGKEISTLSNSGQDALEKTPLMGILNDQNLNEVNNGTHEFYNPISNVSNVSLSHQAGSNKDMVLDVVNSGSFSNEIRGVSSNGNLDNMDAHYNPTYEGFEGSNVTISDNVLDPRKHSPITFKESSNKKGKGSSTNSSRGNFGKRVSSSRERSGGKDLIG
ncbi:hypothetical protein J1N35_026439 [Gossypium stocksii]|uniref:DUF4283 domain-containing protein n=1 Tax=Gossypium stocksii TaxID=47602 RepID=A0A9D3V998_9ROSI|nr:hypothetical protein J1N35_026439 [Gossypium stocksii]